MPRITPVDPQKVAGQTKQLLDAVQNKLGRVPNIFRTLAQSPAALEAYVNFSGALGKGLLSAKLREQIALAVAQQNSCQYCLSAHTALGKMAGLSEADVLGARRGASSDTKTQAALEFARILVDRRAEVSDADVARVRQAGYSDGEIAEIVANVALNVFTNYFNHVAGTEVDFPVVEVSAAATA